MGDDVKRDDGYGVDHLIEESRHGDPGSDHILNRRPGTALATRRAAMVRAKS
jgi:hypothetical protein